MSERPSGMIRFPRAGYEQVRDESLKLQLELKRRIAMNHILLSALKVALRHHDEFIKEINK